MYEIIAWIHIFYKYSNLQQLDKVAKFHSEFYFIFENTYLSTFMGLGFSVAAIIILFFIEAKKVNFLNVFKYFFIVINILAGLLILWGLM